MSQTLLMIDTNTVSFIVSGKSPAARVKLADLEMNETPCISIITEAELRNGLAKAPNPHLLRSSLEGFLAKILVLEWGREEAIAYGELRAKQEAAGKVLGNMDMMIAAHALAVGATLVTNDKGFENAPKLSTVNWATDRSARS